MQTNVKKLKLATILLCEQFNQMNVLKILAFDHLNSTMLVLYPSLESVHKCHLVYIVGSMQIAVSSRIGTNKYDLP